MSKSSTKKEDTANNDCFIIMPIANPEGYEKGHFDKVYEDIFKVACEKSGFNPVRADEVKQTNLIHLDILQKLIDSPMAICDLSNRNPNVLFELGLRQAFDKPTVLVQERGTPKIFDISPMRYTEYRKELKYREVLEDQDRISLALTETKKATENGEGVNSIVSLLSLANPASLKDVSENDTARMMQVIMSEINDLRTDFRMSKKMNPINNKPLKSITYGYIDIYAQAENNYEKLRNAIKLDKDSVEKISMLYNELSSEAGILQHLASTTKEKELASNLSISIDKDFSAYLEKKH